MAKEYRLSLPVASPLKSPMMPRRLLLDLGFHQVRVRIHGMMARIEVEPAEFSKVLENREKITKEFKTYGFTYVTMDLTGYRTGSMNETLGE